MIRLHDESLSHKSRWCDKQDGQGECSGDGGMREAVVLPMQVSVAKHGVGYRLNWGGNLKGAGSL